MRLEADKDFFVCDYCRNIYFPEKNDDGVRVLGEPCGYSCPVCAVPMLHAAVDDQRVFYCGRCRGMMIPMGVFPALVEDLRARVRTHPGGPALALQRPDPQGLQRGLQCALCHRPMDTHFYAGPGNVIIDSCSTCYVNWLDYGELMRIARAPDRVYDEAP